MFSIIIVDNGLCVWFLSRRRSFWYTTRWDYTLFHIRRLSLLFKTICPIQNVRPFLLRRDILDVWESGIIYPNHRNDVFIYCEQCALWISTLSTIQHHLLFNSRVSCVERRTMAEISCGIFIHRAQYQNRVFHLYVSTAVWLHDVVWCW
jgi:hypothetical protein